MRATLAIAGLVAAAALGWPGEAEACRCRSTPPFEEAARGSEAVLLVRVLTLAAPRRFDDHLAAAPFMEVEVLRVVRGHESRPRVRVWGGVGFDCLAELRAFPAGSQWALALDRPSEWKLVLDWFEGAKATDYTLGTCGSRWLPVGGPEDADTPFFQGIRHGAPR